MKQPVKKEKGCRGDPKEDGYSMNKTISVILSLEPPS